MDTDDDIVHNFKLLMRENVYTPKIVRIFTHNQKRNNTMSFKEHVTPRVKQLMDNHTLMELKEGLAEARRGMGQEAEPEGGPIQAQYGDEIEAYETSIRLMEKLYNKGLSAFRGYSC